MCVLDPRRLNEAVREGGPIMAQEEQQAESQAIGDTGGQTLPLTGRVAVVTGSSRGIGRATALRLAGLGADLAINYRSDEQGARETREAIEALGRRAVAFQADVSVEDDVTRL